MYVKFLPDHLLVASLLQLLVFVFIFVFVFLLSLSLSLAMFLFFCCTYFLICSWWPSSFNFLSLFVLVIVYVTVFALLSPSLSMSLSWYLCFFLWYSLLYSLMVAVLLQLLVPQISFKRHYLLVLLLQDLNQLTWKIIVCCLISFSVFWFLYFLISLL